VELGKNWSGQGTRRIILNPWPDGADLRITLEKQRYLEIHVQDPFMISN